MHTGEVREYGYVAAVRSGSASTTPYRLYVNVAVRRDYSSPAAHALRRPRCAPRLLVSGRTRSTSTSPCAATTRLWPHALYVNLVVHRGYLPPVAVTSPQLRRASGCLGTSRGSSRGSLRRSSSTTPPRAGSSSTTSPSPCVRVPGHVARLVMPLVVDYSASPRLVVDYFAFAARPGASARRAARHAARRVARR
jgi:hypothetical protein